ncbi:MAG TPA: Uma2 family endonuclease [Polyangiaceae bacterium]|nr:Uma2 family endonuclease [Polyangiaceae bacterium]
MHTAGRRGATRMVSLDLMRTPAPSPDDPTVYPVEEPVGEDILQCWMLEVLRPLIERWVAERRTPCLVGSDQFIYFEKGQVSKRIAPDIYLLPGVPPNTRIPSWKIWESGIRPSFALEICSLDWHKDYVTAPRLHDEIGTEELIVVDPDYLERREGYRFQRYERTSRGLELQERTQADRVRSGILECFLRLVGTEDEPRQHLRLALDPDGDILFPTQEEAERQRAEAERQRADVERQRADSERQRADSERQRAEAERQRAEAERQRAASESQRAEDERKRAAAAERRAHEDRQQAETQKQLAEAALARVAELEALLKSR